EGLGILEPAPGPENDRLLGKASPKPQRLDPWLQSPNGVGSVVEVENHLRNPASGQMLEEVEDGGAIEERERWFCPVPGERLHPLTVSSGKDHRFHISSGICWYNNGRRDDIRGNPLQLGVLMITAQKNIHTHGYPGLCSNAKYHMFLCSSIRSSVFHEQIKVGRGYEISISKADSSSQGLDRASRPLNFEVVAYGCLIEGDQAFPLSIEGPVLLIAKSDPESHHL